MSAFGWLYLPPRPPRLCRRQIWDVLLVKSQPRFVVDDDAAVLRAVKHLLRRHGYNSVLFPSGEALENHSDFEGAICIILDINLTDGSGIELRYRLKAAGISVPVIYMTGSDKPALRMAALQSGCLAYFEKPFSAKSLIEPLERASTGLT
jgi:FixJ family two-component response regulator